MKDAEKCRKLRRERQQDAILIKYSSEENVWSRLLLQPWYLSSPSRSSSRTFACPLWRSQQTSAANFKPPSSFIKHSASLKLNEGIIPDYTELLKEGIWNSLNRAYYIIPARPLCCIDESHGPTQRVIIPHCIP